MCIFIQFQLLSNFEWTFTLFQVLNVVFENIQENEASGATQNIQVKVLDCDTIGQAKEKILQAFLNKNGSLYGLQLREMGLSKCYANYKFKSSCLFFFLHNYTIVLLFIFNIMVCIFKN